MKITEQEKNRFKRNNDYDKEVFEEEDMTLDNRYSLYFKATCYIKESNNSIDPQENLITFEPLFIEELKVYNLDDEQIVLTEEQETDLEEQIKELINIC